MIMRLLPASLLLACTLSYAANPPPVPKSLEEQVACLVELLKDSYAIGYPKATMVKTLESGKGNQTTLAAFTVEGFDGGINYRQYLAAFTSDTNEVGAVHYQLLDVIHIGGNGWRAIVNLDAKLVGDSTQIDIPVMENTEDDGPNFPSREGVIHLSFAGSRLVEKTPKNAATLLQTPNQ